MYKLTKLDLDLNELPDDTEDHPLVRLELQILAQPLILATAASKRDLKWKDALTWCEELKVGEHRFRSVTIQEGVLVPDYSRDEFPAVDKRFLPNHAGKWVWTSTEERTPPAGCAWAVGLGDGYSDRFLQDGRYGALAVRVGQ